MATATVPPKPPKRGKQRQTGLTVVNGSAAPLTPIELDEDARARASVRQTGRELRKAIAEYQRLCIELGIRQEVEIIVKTPLDYRVEALREEFQ